jgi:hypothetical protein
VHTPRTQEEWERDVIGFKQEEVLAFADRLFAETKAFEMKEQMAPHPVGVVQILCMHVLLLSSRPRAPRPHIFACSCHFPGCTKGVFA